MREDRVGRADAGDAGPSWRFNGRRDQQSVIMESAAMTTRLLVTAAVAALGFAGMAGVSVAQTSGPQSDQSQASQSQSQSRMSQGQQSRRQTSQTRQSTGSRQTAQAGFDPWHSKGHELDNIADKLNACMLHPPEIQQSCIDEAIRTP